MKNEIGYFYHLYPEKMVKKGKRYYFQYQNKNYVFYPYERSLEELKELVLLNKILVKQNLLFPKIVSNVMQQELTFLNGKYYLLREDVLPLNKVSWNEVVYQNTYYLPITQFKWIVRNNWYSLWEKKIDYFEYQREHLYQKFPILFENIDYYIGLAENAIAYVKEVEKNIKKTEKDILTFTRKRIHINDNLSDFYDPISFVIDYKVRDIAEFIKSCFFEIEFSEEEIITLVDKMHLSNYGWGMFVARMMFPSYFFDVYEAIINGKEKESSLEKILQKTESFQEFLTELQLKIRKKASVPPILWLDEKKEVL